MEKKQRKEQQMKEQSHFLYAGKSLSNTRGVNPRSSFNESFADSALGGPHIVYVFPLPVFSMNLASGNKLIFL